jgi:hypothetical protein
VPAIASLMLQLLQEVVLAPKAVILCLEGVTLGQESVVTGQMQVAIQREAADLELRARYLAILRHVQKTGVKRNVSIGLILLSVIEGSGRHRQ